MLGQIKKSRDTSVLGHSEDGEAIPFHGHHRRIHPQAVELGTIDYINLTSDGKHGGYDRAIAASRSPSLRTLSNGVDDPGVKTREPSLPTPPSSERPKSSLFRVPLTLGTETIPIAIEP